MKPTKTNAVLGVTCGLLLVATAVLAFSLGSSARVAESARQRLELRQSSAAFSAGAPSATLKVSGLAWRSLYSTNYQEFIAKLRAFGCPEQTVRDIVIMDIAKLYARKRAEARRQGKPYQYWRTHEPGDHKLESHLAELNREQHKLVRDLLGVEIVSARAQYWEEDDPSVAYDFLPADKRHRLAELLTRFERKIDEVYTRGEGELSARDEEELRALERQRTQELEALLTPEEREAYDLRYSAVAQIIRSEFGGIQLSEQEFRRLFDVYKKYQSDMTQGFAVDQSNRQEFRTPERLTAERGFQEDIRAALGEARFAELQRSQDPAYDVLVQIAQRFNLPPELPSQVYDLKVQAENRKFEIDSNPRLTPEQRRAALAEIARQTESALSTALGPEVYRTYTSAGGDWLGFLSRPDTAGSLLTSPQ